MVNCNHNKAARGLTLLGVLVALFLLASASLSISRLGTGRARITLLARQTLTATSSAREGLELIRAIRDTNWFTVPQEQWAKSLCDEKEMPSFIFDALMAWKQQPPQDAAGADTQLYRQPADGQWVHNNSPTNQPTGYNRVINLDCSQKNEKPAYIDVTSIVTWNFRNQSRQVDIKEKLFNWYPQ